MDKNILEKAILHYGIESQINQCVEEAAELIVAINKARRAGIIKTWGVQIPVIESQMSEVSAYNDLCMEIADVKIMLAQMEIIMDKERIDLSVERKLKRLNDRINKES
jgi:NTP pyrophosphatase (non-canonical NTP hydrolase)